MGCRRWDAGSTNLLFNKEMRFLWLTRLLFAAAHLGELLGMHKLVKHKPTTIGG